MKTQSDGTDPEELDVFQTKQAKLSEENLVASTPVVHSLVKSEWIDSRSKIGRSSSYSPVLLIDSGQLGCEETENLNASSKGTMLFISNTFRGGKRRLERRVTGIRGIKGWQFLLRGSAKWVCMEISFEWGIESISRDKLGAIFEMVSSGVPIPSGLSGNFAIQE
ncbi:hypothetical protein PGTUg99_031008 [Puccinia graminis f. sp. tritici]|uniref:Uncharacterized protein n=1 Tax=Puccinia graminis f. sp. tritici TaxID=56615 RepID=A0A5B0P213_PUCGR|nr:hypothetical protein PGTUg99_031008 [Puccinia graminis f. sp. tritici]